MSHPFHCVSTFFSHGSLWQLWDAEGFFHQRRDKSGQGQEGGVCGAFDVDG